MLVQLKIRLENDKINYRNSSNLQGVLMEHIPIEYAERLHSQGLNPYSQSVIQRDGVTIWTIKTVNQEAYKNIIEPLMKVDFNEVSIKDGAVKVKIVEKTVSIEKKRDLLEAFYAHETERTIKISFDSPTAFKSNGKYVLYPELRLIYQSLMNKYSASSSEISMSDDETLEELEKVSDIISYRLMTQSFPMESVNIPGFRGEIVIRFRGNDTLARYAKLLFRFGMYSGVGIKCGIGMGSIRIIERKGKIHDE